MRARVCLCSCIAAVLVGAAACRRNDTPPPPPATSASPESAPPTVRVIGPLSPEDARALATMNDRLRQYVDLHLKLERSLPKLPDVNGRYPDTVPISTVPPEVLQTLPKLSEDLEYWFVGDALILLDTHARTIADYIENALPT